MNTSVLPISPQSTLPWHEIPEPCLQNYLSLYRPDRIHLSEVRYADERLTAILGHYSPDLYRRPLFHLARVQIVHYVGQAAYVLAGCLAAEGRLYPIDEEGYVERVLDERATFRKLSLSFRQHVPNRAGNVIRMRFNNLRSLKRYMVVGVQFDINDGACFGLAQGILAI